MRVVAYFFMSSREALAVEVKDNVAKVTLLGPGKGNAMGPAFWDEMPVLFAELDADPEVRAIVLTGSGCNFCFGLDLMAMPETERRKLRVQAGVMPPELGPQPT